MANSMYEYVRKYEKSNDYHLLDDCFVVVRVDGHAFHHFSKAHHFKKPNDKRCLDLMIESARHVIKKFYPNILIAYGVSDEFSFLIRRSAKLLGRRQNKITSLIVSTFTSAYVFYWPQFFMPTLTDGTTRANQLLYPPVFDGRCVLYPNEKLVIDYLKWRQVDCHINNLYNTTFHALTGEYTKYTEPGKIYKHIEIANKPQPLTAREATDRLSGTNSSDKNEILFHEFGINYNNELEQFKKGTTIVVRIPDDMPIESREKLKDRKSNENNLNLDEINIDNQISTLNVDIIGEKFWNEHQNLLQ